MERKFLEGLGITDKSIIDSILDQNGAETSALNTRIKAKDTEITTLRSDLATANTKISELSKVDVETLQKQLQDEKDARVADKKAWSLKALLTSKGCTDVDYLVYKLGDSVKFEDDGTVADADNVVKDWIEKYPNQFQTSNDTTETKAGTGSAGNFSRDHSTKTPAKKNPYTKEGFNLTEQMKLEITDPEKAKKLKLEADALS